MPARRASAPASMAARVDVQTRTGAPASESGNRAEVVERPRKLLLSVDDALQVLDYTRPRFYREVNIGRIQILKDGKRTRVPYWELLRYVKMLCDEQRLDLGDVSLAG